MSNETTFLNYSTEKLQQYLERIEACVAKLTPTQLWSRDWAHQNAVGNLLLHLTGNVRQWIVCGVGGELDTRQRQTEFDARGGIATEELIAGLRSAIDAAIAVIGRVTPAQLSEPLKIQGYDVNVLQAIYHVVEHFSGHTGQIIFATKFLTGEDMGFYRHLRVVQPHTEKTP
ncbi:MAG TPA: DUF1572 family protein [Bryobacteraceae bacterium]|nr:DUF1572 family protein [Bryobacteraceae bacterium]